MDSSLHTVIMTEENANFMQTYMSFISDYSLVLMKNAYIKGARLQSCSHGCDLDFLTPPLPNVLLHGLSPIIYSYSRSAYTHTVLKVTYCILDYYIMTT